MAFQCLFGGRHLSLQLLTYLASILNQRQHTSILLILFPITCSSSIVVNDCLSSSTCPIKKEIFSKPYLYIREIYSWSTICEQLPALRTINLSNNLMSPYKSKLLLLKNIQVVVLNNTGVDWEQVPSIFSQLVLQE